MLKSLQRCSVRADRYGLDVASRTTNQLIAIERDIAERQLIDEILTRYPKLRLWLAEHGGRDCFTIIIVEPSAVDARWHRVVHDHELRERARHVIRPDRVNEPGDNAVLVLVPVQ